jgi:hypothetical protein
MPVRPALAQAPPGGPAPPPAAPPPPVTDVKPAPPAAPPPAAPPGPVAEPPPMMMKDDDFRVILDRMIPNIHFGLKLGGAIHGSTGGSLNGFQLDYVYVEPRFSGQVFKWLSWQANFNANGGSYGTSGVHVMDLISQLNLHDAFHVWMGHLLVPSDRANFAGPFFMDAWNYPGFYGGNYLVGPNTGPYGRDTGGVIWGQFLEGKLKYYLGAFNFENITTTPKVAARINVAILGEEPGYYHNATYYGDKNIVAIGGGFEFLKAGETGPAPPQTLACAPTAGSPNMLTCTQNPPGAAPVLGDFAEGSVDLLAEGKFGGTLEAAYYHYDKNYPVGNAYYVLAAYLLPWELGVGKLRPQVRFQQAFGQGANSAIKENVLDASLTYVVRPYDLRFSLNYQRTDLGVGDALNAIQFGVRIQK